MYFCDWPRFHLGSMCRPTWHLKINFKKCSVQLKFMWNNIMCCCTELKDSVCVQTSWYQIPTCCHVLLSCVCVDLPQCHHCMYFNPRNFQFFFLTVNTTCCYCYVTTCSDSSITHIKVQLSRRDGFTIRRCYRCNSQTHSPTPNHTQGMIWHM